MNTRMMAIAAKNLMSYLKSAKLSKVKNESQNPQRSAFGNDSTGDEELKQNILDETEDGDGPENFMKMTEDFLEDPSKSTHAMTEEIAAQVNSPDEEGDIEIENLGVPDDEQEARKMVKNGNISAPGRDSVKKYVYSLNEDTEMGTGKKKKR